MLFRLLFILSLCATEGLAQPPWSVEATYTVPVGQTGRLTIAPSISIQHLKVDLTREDGPGTYSFTARGLTPGTRKSFSFPAPEGRSRWNAAFDAKLKDGGLTSNFRFEVISVKPLKVDLQKSDVDLTKGRLMIQTNQRLSTATLKGFGPNGDVVLDEEVDLPSASGMVPVTFTPMAEGALRRMEIKLRDPVGRWVGFRLVAWYVEIPHDDVIFETGSSEIATTESSKLSAVVQRIQSEVKHFRETLGRNDVGLNLKLYVVGCTDTVGSTQDNLRLSRRRARAIARRFQTLGVSAPIFYEGYGEALLAVPTADGVDEVKNRRAIYILTNTKPSSYTRPDHRWHPMK